MKKTAVCLTVLMLVAGFIFFTEEAVEATRNGFYAAFKAVIPSLFPLSVLSGIIVRLGLADGLASLANRPFKKFFGLQGVAAVPVVLGLAGGYPIGAQTAAEMTANGELSEEQAGRVLVFCNNCGPAFMLATVGAGVFGSMRTGMLLFAVHAGSALTTGLVFAKKHTGGRNIIAKKTRGIGFSSVFTASIQNSVASMLKVAGFIAFFSFITSIIKSTGLFGEGSTPLPFGLLEMAGGTLMLGPGDEAAAALITGFGGLCVFFQTAALFEGTDVPLKHYILGKTFQAALSYLAALSVFNGLSPAVPILAAVFAKTVFLCYHRIKIGKVGKNALFKRQSKKV